MADKDPLRERISLLEMGEARGKLQPKHAAELAWYRQSGASKSTAPVPLGARQQSARSAPPSLDMPVTMPKGQAAQTAYAKVAAARAMKKQLNRVHELYDRNMSGNGVLGGLKEYVPFTAANQEFDGAVAAVPLLARQAFRVAGSGADTEGELKLILDALPSRWSFDGTNKERFRTLDTMLGDMIGNNAGLAGYNAEQVSALRAENPYTPAGRRALPKSPPRSVARQATAAGRAVYDINGNPVR